MHFDGPYALFWIVYLLLMLFGSSIAGVVAAIYLLVRLGSPDERR
jgi:hypothetical protein